MSRVDADEAVLVVSRTPGGWQDRARSYRIKVDGTIRGSIKHGEEVRIDVLPGRHVVAAHIDWTGSPDLEVDVNPGETVKLLARPGGHERRTMRDWILPLVLAKLVRERAWVELTRER